MFITISNYMSRRKTILKELHVAKADKICAGHDSLAMRNKVVHASCVDYSVDQT